MRKLLLRILLLVGNFSFAQVFTPSNMPWQIYTGATLDNMSGATSATSSDVTPTGLISFGSGFTFWYGGVNYTGISMSPDGYVRLGTTASAQPTASFNSSTNYPVLAPYWCNLMHIQPLKYKMIGTSPNRTFIVGWVSDGTYLTSASFQLWLHETTGQFDFVYGTVYSNTGNYSIGHGALIDSRTYMNLVTDTFLAQTLAFFNYAYNLNQLAIQSGTKFSFTPIQGNVNAPVNAQFTNVSAGCLSFDWQDQSMNDAFYRIYRSTDNINFTLLKTIGSDSTLETGDMYSFNDTNLVPQTHYYYKIKDYSFVSSYSDSVMIDTVTAAPSLQGIKMIPGDYPSIYEALESIKCERLSGPIVLELQSNYNDSGEVFPLRINQYLYTSTQNTLTIRPALNATGLTISDSVGYMFDINNAQGITLDGRPGGILNQRELTLENKSTNGVVINMINDAKHDQLFDLIIKGSTTNTNSGSVIIGTTSQLTGNDSILIDSCRFTNTTTGFTANHIYAKGTVGKENDHITISRSDFSNFSTVVINGVSAAINVLQANDWWNVTGNSFYCDTSIVTTKSVYSVRLKNISAMNYSVSGNYFGGAAPFCSGGAMDFSVKTGACIYLASSVSGQTYIYDNVFRNMIFYQNPISAASYTMIIVDTGNVDIHNNDIGRMDILGDIKMLSPGSQNFWGIIAGGPGSALVHNNMLGGIQMIGSGIGSGDIGLIDIGKTPSSIFNNQVGSDSLEASIFSSTNGIIEGIQGNHNIYDNRVAHFWKDSPITGVDNEVYGIRTGAGAQIINNRIWGFHTNAYSGNPVRGIRVDEYGYFGQTRISQNEIFDISVEGIQTQYIAAIEFNTYPTSVPPLRAEISRNFIHHISVTNQTTSEIDGILYELNNYGRVNMFNNFISLGYSSDGGECSEGYSIYGINGGGNVNGQMNAYFNSIYIGGHDSVFNVVTAGIAVLYSSFSDSLYNNIIWNDRIHQSTSCEHLIYENYPNQNNISSDYNLFLTTDPQGGWSSNVSSFSTWQTSGHDVHSIIGLPNFINPSGDTASVDLHLQIPSPAEGIGYNIPWITTDIDSDLRASFGPVDIGADAGNFIMTGMNSSTLSTLDIFPNPSSGQIFIGATKDDKDGMLEICDVTGAIVFKSSVSSLSRSVSGYVLDVSGMASGTYLVSIISDSGKRSSLFLKE